MAETTDKYDEFKQEVNALTLREKLTAETAVEKKVLTWLEKNASSELVEKIAAGEKTIAGSLRYAKDQAKELAKEEQCICVDDDTVFGWIIHFFEEDSISEDKPKPKVKLPASAKVKAESKPEPKPEPKKESPQLSLFGDMFEVK